MSDSTEQSIYGQKTFFIAPSREMIPDEYLQDYLSHGYECYKIPDDGTFTLDQKVQAVISLFPDSLLIFDTTRNISGINWENYIQMLQHTCGDKIKIAAVYSEKWETKAKVHFKSWYSEYAKIQGGIIGLEPDNVQNFERIKTILVTNKVLGRRKAVRAACPPESNVQFSYSDMTFKGSLADISISHFCAEVNMNGVVLPVYEKIKDAVLNVNGMQFASDIVLILRRALNDTTRCIFMFIKQGGLPGLAGGNEEKLSPVIYDIISRKCSEAINNALNGNS